MEMGLQNLWRGERGDVKVILTHHFIKSQNSPYYFQRLNYLSENIKIVDSCSITIKLFSKYVRRRGRGPKILK